MRHPRDNADYESFGDGTVRVRDLDSGLEGIFAVTGEWRSGALKWADPHLIRWVGDKGDRTLASTRVITPDRFQGAS